MQIRALLCFSVFVGGATFAFAQPRHGARHEGVVSSDAVHRRDQAALVRAERLFCDDVHGDVAEFLALVKSQGDAPALLSKFRADLLQRIANLDRDLRKGRAQVELLKGQIEDLDLVARAETFGGIHRGSALIAPQAPKLRFRQKPNPPYSQDLKSFLKLYGRLGEETPMQVTSNRTEAFYSFELSLEKVQGAERDRFVKSRQLQELLGEQNSIVGRRHRLQNLLREISPRTSFKDRIHNLETLRIFVPDVGGELFLVESQASQQPTALELCKVYRANNPLPEAHLAISREDCEAGREHLRLVIAKYEYEAANDKRFSLGLDRGFLKRLAQEDIERLRASRAQYQQTERIDQEIARKAAFASKVSGAESFSFSELSNFFSFSFTKIQYGVRETARGYEVFPVIRRIVSNPKVQEVQGYPPPASYQLSDPEFLMNRPLFVIPRSLVDPKAWAEEQAGSATGGESRHKGYLFSADYLTSLMMKILSKDCDGLPSSGKTQLPEGFAISPYTSSGFGSLMFFQGL